MPENYPVITELPEPAVGELKLLESALSHDVEGSVRGIKTLASILVRKHTPTLQGEAGDLVKLLGAEAERASRLLDGVMDWLKYAQLPLRLGWQDTALIAKEAFSEASASFPEQRMDFQMSTLPSLWSDEIAIRKIFRELFSNAFKFTTTKPSAIVSVSALEMKEETVLTVRDNGVGFDAHHSDQLFKLFRRMHRRQEFAGDGVGLAVVREIVQRHCGRVWAEAQIDAGAAFHLAFPKPAVDETGAPPDPLFTR